MINERAAIEFLPMVLSQPDALPIPDVTKDLQMNKKKRHDIRVTGSRTAIARIADKCLDAFGCDTG